MDDAILEQAYDFPFDIVSYSHWNSKHESKIEKINSKTIDMQNGQCFGDASTLILLEYSQQVSEQGLKQRI